MERTGEIALKIGSLLSLLVVLLVGEGVGASENLRIQARTSDGSEVRVFGTVRCDGGNELQVDSEQPLALRGRCEFEVGVKTRNGNLFKPVTQIIEVNSQLREVKLEVVEPPAVRINFFDSGQKIEETPAILGYQQDEVVLGIRGKQWFYVDPGEYEFRTEPSFFFPLSLSVLIEEGDRRDLRFEVPRLVNLKIRLYAAKWGVDFREKYELWREGRFFKKVHWINGIWLEPGPYEIRLNNPLVQFLVPEIEVSTEEEQLVKFEVPTALIEVSYERWDGKKDRHASFFLRRWTGDAWSETFVERSGRAIPLAEGRWKVEGWNRRGRTFGSEEFTIAVGEQRKIILREFR